MCVYEQSTSIMYVQGHRFVWPLSFATFLETGVSHVSTLGRVKVKELVESGGG
jgi:hypothetical protein